MMTYFLGEETRQWLEQRAAWSGLAEPEQDGYFRLFNKNGAETIFVKPLSKTPDRFGWLVEYTGEVPAYFRSILRDAS